MIEDLRNRAIKPEDGWRIPALVVATQGPLCGCTTCGIPCNSVLTIVDVGRWCRACLSGDHRTKF